MAYYIGGKDGLFQRITTEDIFGGETPLMAACAYYDLDLVKYFIEKYAVDVNQRGTLRIKEIKKINNTIGTYMKTDGTAIHAAVLSGNFEIVEYLVKTCKANINATTGEILLSESEHYGGLTPLHLAVISLHLFDSMVQCEMIRFLLEIGADWNIRDSHGKQCWELTSNVDLTKFMIYLGIGLDPSMNTTLSTVAHHWARVHQERSSEVVKLAISKGVDINQPDAFGFTPLMIAALGKDGDCPNEDVFRLILMLYGYKISRLHRTAAYELIGATFITFDNVYKGLQYWKKAMELRFGHQPPIPKPFVALLSESARLAFKGMSEVQTLQEIEELQSHNSSSFKVQALLTCIRILGLNNIETFIRSFLFSISFWKKDKQHFIDCTKFVLESFNIVEDYITWEKSCTLIFLFVFAVNNCDRFSIAHNNYTNTMPILRKLVDILKQTDNSSAYFENHQTDIETFVLLHIIFLLDVMVCFADLNSSQEQELKCCLHEAVLLGKRDSKGYDLLLLACVPQFYDIPTSCFDLHLQRTISADVISFLVEVGADSNSTSNEGDTALHILARYNETFKSDSIRVMCEAGTHIGQTNSQGKTAADIMSEIPNDSPSAIL